MSVSDELNASDEPDPRPRGRSVRDARPVIALTGAEGAGQSAVLTLLLGQMAVPPRTTASPRPAVWLSHGKHGSFYVAKDASFHPVDPQNIASVPATSQFIKVFVEADILELCDLLDLPPVGEERMPSAEWTTLARQADAAIWCTAAPNPWQPFEEDVWSDLPSALQKNAMLIATRAEVLSDDLQTAVRARLARDLDGRFAAQFMISAVLAARARVAKGNPQREELWRASGMPAVLKAIQMRIPDITPKADGPYIPPVDLVDPLPADTDEIMDELDDFSAPKQQVLRARG